MKKVELIENINDEFKELDKLIIEIKNILKKTKRETDILRRKTLKI